MSIFVINHPELPESTVVVFASDVEKKMDEELAQKKETVLRIEAVAAEWASSGLRLGIRVRGLDDAEAHGRAATWIHVGMFAPDQGGGLFKASMMESEAGAALCEELARRLDGWVAQVVQMKRAISPGKMWAMVPLEDAARVMAFHLMGDDDSRAWTAQRESSELNKVAGQGKTMGAVGPRL